MTIVEYLADIVEETDRWDDWSKIEFEYYIADDLDDKYKLTDAQYEHLAHRIRFWLEKEVFDELEEEIESRIESAREWEDARRSAVYG